MTVEETKVIDFIGVAEEIDTVVLTISDHLEWGNLEHIYSLQEKINAYLRFIESEEIYENLPELLGKKLKISVKLKYPPDDAGIAFLDNVTNIVLSAGFQFEYSVS